MTVIYDHGLPEVGTHQHTRVRQWLGANGINYRIIPRDSKVYVEDGVIHYEEFVVDETTARKVLDDNQEPMVVQHTKLVTVPWEEA